jgi:hypothetical protein
MGCDSKCETRRNLIQFVKTEKLAKNWPSKLGSLLVFPRTLRGIALSDSYFADWLVCGASLKVAHLESAIEKVSTAFPSDRPNLC